MLELGALRYTPAGVAALEFKLAHESQQAEAGSPRQVHAELSAIAFDIQAKLLTGRALGTPLRVEGFIGAKNKRSKRLVLHVTKIEFIEGEIDATAAQR